MTTIKPQIQETQRTSSVINTKNLPLGTSYSNCKKSKTKRKSLIRTVPQGKSLQRTERTSIIFTIFERALKRIIKYQTYKIFDIHSTKQVTRYHMIKYPIVKSAFGEHRHREGSVQLWSNQVRYFFWLDAQELVKGWLDRREDCLMDFPVNTYGSCFCCFARYLKSSVDHKNTLYIGCFFSKLKSIGKK